MGLADRKKKVLLVDLDAQGSLSIAMGCDYPERRPITMAELLQKQEDTQRNQKVIEGILSVSAYLDYFPANRKMALVEQELVLTKGKSLSDEDGGFSEAGKVDRSYRI